MKQPEHLMTRPGCGILKPTRRIIRHRGPQLPRPWRAFCACGHVSSGATRQEANRFLTLHMDQEIGA